MCSTQCVRIYTALACGHLQSLKQVYVVVLGLDVIGNPVGLLTGFTTGVGDFFYEPLQGAIQGPEEFAEGLATGVRSLIGHTVGECYAWKMKTLCAVDRCIIPKGLPDQR